MTALPRTFRDEIHSGGGDSFDRVGGGVPGVTSHVGGAGGVTGCTGDGTSRIFIGSAGGSVGGNCGGARNAAHYLTTHPGTRGFNGFARSVVLRVLLLKQWKHMLGAVGGPERKQSLVLLVEMPGCLPGSWWCGCFHNPSTSFGLEFRVYGSGENRRPTA